MDFELTISGLCLLVMKPKIPGDSMPVDPTNVEVFCPAAHHHRAVLCYEPEGVKTDLEPELVVGYRGKRYAQLDLMGQVWSLKLEEGPREFTVNWGTPKDDPRIPETGQQAPAGAAEEDWLHWVPRLAEIGFSGFEMPGDGQLPPLGATRFALPWGSIYAADIVGDDDQADGYSRWRFPAAADRVRTLANHMVFQARGVDKVTVASTVGATLSVEGGASLHMSLSHDLARVPRDYNQGGDVLDHLAVLEGMGWITGDFEAPERVSERATAKPICNGIVHVL